MRVTGGPDERGGAYGQLARDRIAGTIRLYKLVFEQLAGLDWDAAHRRALQNRAIIEQFLAGRLARDRGNSPWRVARPVRGPSHQRTREIMFQAAGSTLAATPAVECTSFALEPQATAAGRVLAGQ